MEQKNNAKCPLCGAELYVGYNKGTGLCTNCKKEFDIAKAIKLMQTINEKEVEEPIVATGEAYLEVDRILTRVEFYLERKEYDKAKSELESALKITNTDYRVYFGFVRVETKNLTDYRNVTHKPYLEKALSCADIDEKTTIMRLYKDFYQLSKCSDEDIEIYNGEKNVAVKQKLEKRLKQSIPSYMKTESGLKSKLVFGIVSAAVGVAAFVSGFLFSIDLVMLLGAVGLVLTYVFLRGYFVNKRTVAIFNAFLDFYDVVDNFNFSIAKKAEILDCMKLCAKQFEQKRNERAIDTEIYRLCKIVIETKENSAIEFLKGHAVLSKFSE